MFYKRTQLSRLGRRKLIIVHFLCALQVARLMHQLDVLQQEKDVASKGEASPEFTEKLNEDHATERNTAEKDCRIEQGIEQDHERK